MAANNNNYQKSVCTLIQNSSIAKGFLCEFIDNSGQLCSGFITAINGNTIDLEFWDGTSGQDTVQLKSLNSEVEVVLTSSDIAMQFTCRFLDIIFFQFNANCIAQIRNNKNFEFASVDGNQYQSQNYLQNCHVFGYSQTINYSTFGVKLRSNISIETESEFGLPIINGQNEIIGLHGTAGIQEGHRLTSLTTSMCCIKFAIKKYKANLHNERNKYQKLKDMLSNDKEFLNTITKVRVISEEPIFQWASSNPVFNEQGMTVKVWFLRTLYCWFWTAGDVTPETLNSYQWMPVAVSDEFPMPVGNANFPASRQNDNFDVFGFFQIHGNDFLYSEERQQSLKETQDRYKNELEKKLQLSIKILEDNEECITKAIKTTKKAHLEIKQEGDKKKRKSAENIQPKKKLNGSTVWKININKPDIIVDPGVCLVPNGRSNKLLFMCDQKNQLLLSLDGSNKIFKEYPCKAFNAHVKDSKNNSETMYHVPLCVAFYSLYSENLLIVGTKGGIILFKIIEQNNEDNLQVDLQDGEYYQLENLEVVNVCVCNQLIWIGSEENIYAFRLKNLNSTFNMAAAAEKSRVLLKDLHYIFDIKDNCALNTDKSVLFRSRIWSWCDKDIYSIDLNLEKNPFLVDWIVLSVMGLRVDRDAKLLYYVVTTPETDKNKYAILCQRLNWDPNNH